ncbi:MAG: hypothetical protein D8M58_21325 [Calditrichaeota bacterium]|nr:MAG: hypothetical protein DWQ03_00050 [Calditrichota bacterium]MBL1207955.1 hypothetical protein [Calditrichota bacterium]NOG47792.1 hypothetical protein [Calditrichota bacterium]
MQTNKVRDLKKVEKTIYFKRVIPLERMACWGYLLMPTIIKSKGEKMIKYQSSSQADFYFGKDQTAVSFGLSKNEISVATEIFRNPVYSADLFKQIVLTDKKSILVVPENLIDNIFWCSSKHIDQTNLGYAIQLKLVEIRHQLFQLFNRETLNKILTCLGFKRFSKYISLDFGLKGIFENFYIPNEDLISNSSRFLNFYQTDSLTVKLSSNLFTSDLFNSIYSNLLLREGDYKILFGENYCKRNQEKIERRVQQISLLTDPINN